MMWGQLTELVYGFIRDSSHKQGIKLLQEQLSIFPNCQAVLSLLAYCHYMIGDFHAATSMYEQLISFHPNEERYRLYHAQTLYKAEMLGEAAKACLAVDGYKQSILNLQSCILHSKGDNVGSLMILEQIANNDIDGLVNLGCCLYQEGNFEEAHAKFTAAMNVTGFQPKLAYNKSLCIFRLNQLPEAVTALTDIFALGVKEHPEFKVGNHWKGEELWGITNRHILKETALIESFNLKATIHFLNGDVDAAREALVNMPVHIEKELDHLSLHNQALMNMDREPTTGFCKLNYLLQNGCSPPETFGNLLLLYCKPSNGLYDLAADVMAENADLTLRHLTQDLYEYLDATILAGPGVEDAYVKFNELANRNCEVLRGLAKRVEENRMSQEQVIYSKAIFEYERTIERYIPVVMAMAKIWWDKEDYVQTDHVLHQTPDLCKEHELWKINVAHTFFMQENRYTEAIHYYKPMVEEVGDHVLTVTPTVLANLCVAYIMTIQNDKAEDLMRKIEKDDERAHYENSSRQTLHLCIVNLVIGTLYCVEQNFEFGIGRIIKSLEPYDINIEPDTWFYAKRCILALIDSLAKHMIVLKDDTYADIEQFLDAVEMNGRDIVTQNSLEAYNSVVGKNNLGNFGSPSVSQEAKLFKQIFIQLRD